MTSNDIFCGVTAVITIRHRHFIFAPLLGIISAALFHFSSTLFDRMTTLFTDLFPANLVLYFLGIGTLFVSLGIFSKRWNDISQSLKEFGWYILDLALSATLIMIGMFLYITIIEYNKIQTWIAFIILFLLCCMVVLACSSQEYIEEFEKTLNNQRNFIAFVLLLSLSEIYLMYTLAKV